MSTSATTAPAPPKKPRRSVVARLTSLRDARARMQRYFDAVGFGSSLGVHLLILLVLWFWLLPQIPKDEPMIVSSMGNNSEGPLFEDIPDLEIEVTEINRDVPTLTVDSASQALSVNSLLAVAGGTAGEGNSSGVGFPRPGSGRVFSKGSFTAWTIPDDPEPYKPYLIIIQVRLPNSITKYSQNDISGQLVGDDGYETPIGSWRGGRISRQGENFDKKYYGDFDMAAKQFVIKIPGGKQKVKDRIEIESNILKEKQVIIIEF